MFRREKVKEVIQKFSEVDEVATNNQTITLGNMSEEGLFIVGHKDDFLMVYTDYDANGEPKPFFTIASRFGNLYTYREDTEYNQKEMREAENYIKDCIFEYFPDLYNEKNKYDFDGLKKALEQYRSTMSGGHCNDWIITKGVYNSNIEFVVNYKGDDLFYAEGIENTFDYQIKFTGNMELTTWEEGKMVLLCNQCLNADYKHCVELTATIEDYKDEEEQER